MDGARLSVTDHKQREKEGDRSRNEHVWERRWKQGGTCDGNVMKKGCWGGKKDKMDQRGSKGSIGRVGLGGGGGKRELKKTNVKVFSEEVLRTWSGKKKWGSRQMHDSVSNPYGREGIYPLTAASRPDEVWPSGGRTGPEDFPLLQNTSCLLFSCNVTAHSLLPCHTLTCTICYFCVAPLAHRLHSWLCKNPPALDRLHRSK